MSSSPSLSAAEIPNAIVLANVTKAFRKQTIRRGHTTFKSELVRWLKGQKRQQAAKTQVIQELTLAIPRGATVGVIGRNGSGKSTLLKLITGIYSPDQGEVQVHGRISALLDLGAGFHPDFSGRENILINAMMLGMSRSEAKARTPEIIDFSELGDFIDEPVRTYSSGMYMRLAFSVATHVDPEVLIVDEILAVGDEHFSRKSMAKMNEFKRAGKTILIVTHDLTTVERWCDLAAWVDGGRIRELGRPLEVVQQYRRAVELSEAQRSSGAGANADVPGGLGGAAQAQGTEARIEGVQLLDRAVQATADAPDQRDTEEGLQLEVRYSQAAPLGDFGVGVTLYRTDGTRLYSTDTFVSELQQPAAGPLQGSVVLNIDRLGLLPGDYGLDVALLKASGEAYDVRHGAHTFKVNTQVRDRGLYRPVHHWKWKGSAA